MHPSLRRVSVLLVFANCASCLWAQSGFFLPNEIYIGHSASGQRPLSPETGLAPGSIAEVNLTGIAQDGGLSGVQRLVLRIRTAGETEPRELTVLESQGTIGGIATQYRVLIPEDARPGQAELQAVADESRTFTAPLEISRSNFGVFRDASFGWNHARTDKTFTRAAAVGEYLTLWGTGLGPPHPSFDPVISVSIGGVAAAPSYVGPAPGLPGVDQINLRIPEGVPYDCFVPVVVEVAGRASNRVTVPVSGTAGFCRHPLGFSAAELQRLDAGEPVPVVEMSLSSYAAPDPQSARVGPYKRWDAIQMSLWRRDAPGMFSLAPPLIPSSEQFSCSAPAYEGFVISPGFMRVSPLDRETLPPSVSGPGFGTLALPGQSGVYRSLVTETASLPLSALPDSVFRAGTWSFDRPATAVLGAIRQSFHVPPPLRLRTEGFGFQLREGTPFTLEWEADGYSEADVVAATIQVSGNSATPASFSMVCRAPASAGTLTFPQEALQRIGPGRGSVSVSLTRRRDMPLLFEVPLAEGGQAKGLFSYRFEDQVQLSIP